MPSLLHLELLLQRSQAGVGLEGLAQGTRSISANVVKLETAAREGRGREKREGEDKRRRRKREKNEREGETSRGGGHRKYRYTHTKRKDEREIKDRREE